MYVCVFYMYGVHLGCVYGICVCGGSTGSIGSLGCVVCSVCVCVVFVCVRMWCVVYVLGMCGIYVCCVCTYTTELEFRKRYN